MAVAVHIRAIGRDKNRQRSVRTGWMNFSGVNMVMAQAMTRNRMIQKFGSVAKITNTSIFHVAGKPENELSLVFIRVSTMYIVEV